MSVCPIDLLCCAVCPDPACHSNHCSHKSLCTDSQLTAAGLMAECNAAGFGLLNYKTNFQLCQSMFSAELVSPDARISHSRCRPAMPIDGKNRKRILWLLHSLEHKYTFQPSFPPLLFCSSLSTFYLLLFICDYWRDFDENERGTKQVLRDPSDSAVGPRQAPSTATAVSRFTL